MQAAISSSWHAEVEQMTSATCLESCNQYKMIGCCKRSENARIDQEILIRFDNPISQFMWFDFFSFSIVIVVWWLLFLTGALDRKLSNSTEFQRPKDGVTNHLQVLISNEHFCWSIGNSFRFIGHDKVNDTLEMQFRYLRHGGTVLLFEANLPNAVQNPAVGVNS